jgi:hypothetical protein
LAQDSDAEGAGAVVADGEEVSEAGAHATAAVARAPSASSFEGRSIKASRGGLPEGIRGSGYRVRPISLYSVITGETRPGSLGCGTLETPEGPSPDQEETLTYFTS